MNLVNLTGPRAALFVYIEIFYNQRQAPLEHRLPDVVTGQEGHDHRSGRIGEERPGPDFGVNVSSPVYVHKHLISLQTSAFP